MKKIYQTHQRKLLIDFLMSHSEEQYTIEQIASALQNIGKSTLYRLMNSLVEEGAVSRTPINNSRHFVYQVYNCDDCHMHLHLKCSDCGKLIHLGNKESEIMQRLIIESNDFDVDGSKTVLVGRCGQCKRQEVL